MTKFLKVFTLSVVIFSLIIGTATGAYLLMSKKNKTAAETSGTNLNTPTGKKPGDTKVNEDGTVEPVKQVTNFLVLGTDKDGYRTDVVMVASLNHVTNDVSVISIPRDTGVTLPADVYSEMRSRGKKIGKEIAINLVPSYSLVKDRDKNSVLVIEENFGIDIDHYVKVDLKAFRQIIDIVGSISFDPKISKPLEWDDPVQDFYIRIQPGLQSFNGAKAEQLIRWRKNNNGHQYDDGDIGRINMQQRFLKEVLKEVLGERNKTNLLRIGTVILSKVETDFDKLMDYLQYLEGLSVDKINFQSVKGKWVGSKNLYVVDKEAIKKQFKAITTVEEPTTPTVNNDTETNTNKPTTQPTKKPEPVSSKGLKIQVLNGTGKDGLAGRTQKKLKAEGYTVPTVGNYDRRPERTLIIIPNEGMGEDLVSYFDKPEIKLQPENMPEGVDIQIIIGMADKEAY